MSDEPDASARIARFSDSDRRWLVSVLMVSEGVDIARRRVAATRIMGRPPPGRVGSPARRRVAATRIVATRIVATLARPACVAPR